MEAVLDRFGRIVIPKAIRDRLGLETGTRFAIEEKDDAVVLSLPDRGPVIEDEEGVLVFTGRATGPLTDAVAGDRGARMRRFRF